MQISTSKKVKVILYLIMIIILFVLCFYSYNSYQLRAKYPEIIKTLQLGQQMISNNTVGEECAYVDFTQFKELKGKSIFNLGAPRQTDEKEKYLGGKDTQCIQNAKLIAIEYKYGHGRATYLCEKGDIITEFTWTDFHDSCSYVRYLKSWNLPEGRYSLLSVNRP